MWTVEMTTFAADVGFIGAAILGVLVLIFGFRRIAEMVGGAPRRRDWSPYRNEEHFRHDVEECREACKRYYH